MTATGRVRHSWQRATARARARWRLRRAARRAAGPGEPLTPCEARVSSQNGEDGVLAAILHRIGDGDRRFVEFGIGGGEQGCCVALAELGGWSGWFFEADPAAYERLERRYASLPRVRTGCERITAGNVEAVFTAHEVPERFDVLSLDIDGNDFWVWQALTAFRPRVVVVEYNAHLALDRRLVMPRDDDHSWDGTDHFGASLGAWCRLAEAKDYALVHTDSTGVNAFFVTDEEAVPLPRGEAVPRHQANLFGTGVRLPVDPRARPFLDLDTNELVAAPRK